MEIKVDLKSIINTIEYLTKIKEQEERKQLDKLKEKIEHELLLTIENELLNFESDALVEFSEETKKDVCFDYNEGELLEKIKEILSINVWEI